MSAGPEQLSWQAEVSVTRQQVFQRLSGEFKRAGLDTPELDARLLLCHAGGFTHEAFVCEPGTMVDEALFETICSFETRRLSGEPVSRILGQRSFWKYDFALNANTLDPRPDTETLVEATLSIVRGEGDAMQAPFIADLGTGSGCILLSLLGELPNAKGIGIDVSGEALIMAQENAISLGLQDQAQFVQGSWSDLERTSWLDKFEKPFDVVVSNPPYIPSREIASLKREVARFDPLCALDGGPDGLDAFMAIIPTLRSCLKIGGWVLFEVGAGQGDAVGGLLEANGFEVAEEEAEWLRFRDFNGLTRIVAAKQRFFVCGNHTKK